MDVEGLFFHAEYNPTLSRPVIYLKGETGYSKVLLPKKPYIFVEKDKISLEKIRKTVFKYKGETVKPVKVEDVKKLDMGLEKDFYKIYLEKPEYRRPFQDKLKVSCRAVERDPLQQALLDYNLTPLTYYSVETRKTVIKGVRYLEAEGFKPLNKEAELGKLYFYPVIYSRWGYPTPDDPILYIAVKLDGEERLLSSNELDDTTLIKDFFQIFKQYDPDLVISYSQDSDFFPHLFNRARKHGIPIDISRNGLEPLETGHFFRGMILKEVLIWGRVNIDLFPIAWRDFPELPTKSLMEICEKIGVEKPLYVPPYLIDETFKSDRGRLEEMAIDTCRKIEEMSEKTLPFQFELSKLTMLPPHQQIRTTVGDLVEARALIALYRENWVEPVSKPSKRMSYYVGGLVWLKSPGIYENVGYLDFKSMYPSIISQYNISPETVDPDPRFCSEKLEEIIVGDIKHAVCRSKLGLISSLVKELLEVREELKSRLKSIPKTSSEYKRYSAAEHAVKVLANATYGFMGWTRSILYDKGAAELVTALGRKFINEVRRIVEEEGFKTIYMDTDGIQITGGKEEDYLRLVEKINGMLPITIEYEYTASRAIYLTKKKYAHLVNGELVAKGYEFIRKDYPQIIKKAQKAAVMVLLNGGSIEEAKKAQGLIKAKKVIPMHYNSIEGVARYEKHEIQIENGLVLLPGEEIEV